MIDNERDGGRVEKHPLVIDEGLGVGEHRDLSYLLPFSVATVCLTLKLTKFVTRI